MTTLVTHSGLTSGIMSLTLFSQAMAMPMEPDLEQVVAWTIENANLRPGSLDVVAKRARSSSALPDVSLRYAYGLDDRSRSSIDGQSESLNQGVDSSLAQGRDHRIEGVLRWRLSRMRFHPVEPRLLLQKERRNQRRHELSMEATRLFFKWRRFLEELDRLDGAANRQASDSAEQNDDADRSDPAPQLSLTAQRERNALIRELRLAQGQLDVLTGRRFSRHLKRGGHL